MFSIFGIALAMWMNFLECFTIWVFARGNVWRLKMFKRGRTRWFPTTFIFIHIICHFFRTSRGHTLYIHTLHYSNHSNFYYKELKNNVSYLLSTWYSLHPPRRLFHCAHSSFRAIMAGQGQKLNHFYHSSQLTHYFSKKQSASPFSQNMKSAYFSKAHLKGRTSKVRIFDIFSDQLFLQKPRRSSTRTTSM